MLRDLLASRHTPEPRRSMKNGDQQLLRWSRFDRAFREWAVPEIRAPSATRLLYLELPNAQALGERAPEVLRDLVTCTVFVNRTRYVDHGDSPAIALLLS